MNCGAKKDLPNPPLLRVSLHRGTLQTGGRRPTPRDSAPRVAVEAKKVQSPRRRILRKRFFSRAFYRQLREGEERGCLSVVKFHPEGRGALPEVKRRSSVALPALSATGPLGILHPLRDSQLESLVSVSSKKRWIQTRRTPPPREHFGPFTRNAWRLPSRHR